MIKLMQLLSELNINKPVRTWDFSKHIPNFDPLKMRKGDKIINYIDGVNLIFDEIDRNAIITHSEKNNNKITLNLNQMVLDNRNRKYGIRELGINNPNITADQAWDYLMMWIYGSDKIAWKEFWQIWVKYAKKNSIDIGTLGPNDFASLPQQDLNKLYSEMKQLVQRSSDINELQITQPTLYIYGEYGDVQYFANSPLKGNEVELLETEDSEEYKILFQDDNGKPSSSLFPQILDLHDYGVLTKWLKLNRIPFSIDEWSYDFTENGNEETQGVDLYIPFKYIKFITDESI